MIKDFLFFKRVCVEKSIRKASEALFITPQGLSKALKNLERELGVKLLVRTGEGVALTEHGEIVERYADTIIASVDAMKAEIGDRHSAIDGRVSLAMSYGVVSALQPEFLADFETLHPGIRLHITEHPDMQCEQAVADGEAEVGLTIGSVSKAKYTSQRIYRGQMCLLLNRSHRLAGRRSVSFSDLKQEKFIVVNENFKTYHNIVKLCARHGFAPKIALKVSEIGMIHKFCRQNRGVGVTVDYVLKDERDDDLVGIPFAPDSLCPWEVFLFMKKGGALPTPVRDFVGHVLERFAPNRK